MAGDSEIVVNIRADAADIEDQLRAISSKLTNLGSIADDGMSSMLAKFNPLKLGWAGVAVTVAAVSAAIFKAAEEMAIMGEKLTQVENGFLRTAANAGIAGEELKEAMFKASDGVLDVNDLLQRSSQLIVALGRGAERIPEVIGLARQVAKTYGLESEQAFNSISEAVRNGNTRMLKQYGIIIDSEAAVRKFAAANGVAANSLNEQGRAQAILNAVLEKGAQAFGNSSKQTRTLGESAAALKVAMHDAFEAITVQIYNRLGPALTFLIGKAADAATSIAHMLTPATLSEQVSAAEAELNKLSMRLIETQRMAAKFGNYGLGSLFDVEGAQKKFDEAKAKLLELRKLQSEEAKPTAAASSGASSADITDKERLKQNEVKFQSDLAAIRLQAAQAQISNARTSEELDLAQKARALDMEMQFRAKIRELDQNDMLTLPQKNALKLQQQALYEEQVRALEEQKRQEKLAQDQLAVQNAQSFNDQIAASAELAADRTRDAWRKAGSLGGAAMSAFSNRTIAAFTAMGNGSQSAGEALKGAFFGMLGDMASAQGQFMFLSSLWPPNPVGMAAGLGLIALGGLLSSLGSGGGSVAGGASSGGGGGGYGGMAAATPSATTAAPTKAVTITIEGNYFDNEQSRLAIVEAMRSASDANDFTVQRGNRY